MKTKTFLTILIFLLLLIPYGTANPSEEGTRHITGTLLDIHFMNDKVFGTAGRHPLWAIYKCGMDIKGEIDIDGTYHTFAFTYHPKAERIVTGTFGMLKMALGQIKRTDGGFVYQLFAGEKEYRFSIRYEKVKDDHLLNSVIEGSISGDTSIKVTVDGPLCPFATTGIIMIVAGAVMLTGTK